MQEGKGVEKIMSAKINDLRSALALLEMCFFAGFYFFNNP